MSLLAERGLLQPRAVHDNRPPQSCGTLQLFMGSLWYTVTRMRGIYQGMLFIAIIAESHKLKECRIYLYRKTHAFKAIVPNLHAWLHLSM